MEEEEEAAAEQEANVPLATLALYNSSVSLILCSSICLSSVVVGRAARASNKCSSRLEEAADLPASQPVDWMEGRADMQQAADQLACVLLELSRKKGLAPAQI